MHDQLLLKLDNLTARYGEKIVFKDLSFEVRSGECWALLGHSGSGKSALLEAIAGNFNVVKGQVIRPFYDEYIRAHPPKDPYFNYRQLISYLPVKYQFKNLSNTSEFFYQQRFNAAFSEDAPTVEDFLNDEAQKSLAEGSWDVSKVISLFQLEPLRQKQLIKLSNGETKRLRLAASLLKNPRLLLLDSPLVGLDVTTRTAFNSILDEIITSGIAIVLTTAVDEIPSVVTHAVILDNCQIEQVATRERFSSIKLSTPPSYSLDATKVNRLTENQPLSKYKLIVGMKEVTVKYGDSTILSGVSWAIKPGERWALRGQNGAGKSTLLSLINGDNPQAYANDITLFDHKRGSGESIWDIKKKIGFVSPELLQYFHSRATCWEIVASGFHDTLGYLKPVNKEQASLVDEWLDLLELQRSGTQIFETASPTTQRIILLARAMTKNPPLLILDEPCQGLDHVQQTRVRTVVDAVCSASSTALIYVTHYEEELPACVDHVLQLEKGRRVI
ncbi:ATP-binding cassette domain-containing protein [Imperialibacter roseus]|uniref:ATP-binding cassette domain-containing protein n=1 Tax=Imperialibacter roseus TaxID=1324217 RepID=A0ABZ0ILN2_9BACT|nr:ATP-binding cassette domain-containing protein [Imperialibacter roseus]WOK05927.1 ATP-binding cassette domain-containing protein [Imperialibacter roseus]